MGIIAVRLEDEEGVLVREVEGRTHQLDSLLYSVADDLSLQCLRFIDPVGDTVFNRLQMSQFMTEWKSLMPLARTPQQQGVLDEVMSLAEECASEPHTYLKFYGD